VKEIAMKFIRFRRTKIKRVSERGATEYEDGAQRLAMLKTDIIQFARCLKCLDRVNRALKKAAEGGYGASDVGG
jgi:hypothetical protein